MQVRNNQNRSEKCQKFEKIQLRTDGDSFLKNFGKIPKFWSLGLEFQVSSLSLSLGIFDEVAVFK